MKAHPNSNLVVNYVDNTAAVFEGHEPYPHFSTVNDKRWINEFTETGGHHMKDGYTEAEASLDLNEWYHPNRRGHYEIALNIANKFGEWSRKTKGTKNEFHVPAKRVLANPNVYAEHLKKSVENAKAAMKGEDDLRGEWTDVDALVCAPERTTP
ncbi:hypothetical protein INS90_01150 [Trueperella pecoris]|uniref:Uncharacterized protein n=1 Tax=Trueperella pecoris TaxID=2733571 RepID=A0A7M1R1B2_9ACTO|nr:hypothetical protein [Trueperella pecoris]QOR47943.1 hypothetical protein INS90_01150 [Trueperella pecoris]